MGSNVGEVRPTPEMVAMAGRIAARMCSCECGDAGSAALTAIMEVSEAAAKYQQKCQRNMMLVDPDDYRNGEHLR